MGADVVVFGRKGGQVFSAAASSALQGLAGFGVAAKGAVMWAVKAEAALQEDAIHFLDFQGVFDIADGGLVVEVTTREDVHREVVEGGEGVDGDMAFSDDDEARDAGVFRVGSLILEHVWPADFGHADGAWVIVQNLLDEDSVG